MAVRIVFTGKQEIEVREYEAQEPEAGQVAVRSLYSLMSTGTENICFNRLFAEGTNWHNWVKYPFYPGYSLIGEVTEIGPDVAEDIKVGDRVALRSSHASHHVLSAAHCYPVPDGIDLKDAAWFSLGKIAWQGARAADYRLGDTVLVIGAGPIGQMSLRWAVAADADAVIAVDPWERRLEYARRGGATAGIASTVEECRDELRRLLGDKLPRVVLDATGNAAVLPHALRLAANRGRVALIGDTGTPGEQRLTGDILMRGLTLTGAHDGHNDAEWNNATITAHLFRQVLAGRFNISGLITHTFLPDQAAEAYRLANAHREETLGILFDWTGVS
jgi:2-desacetyl-2-hydroxyethyl bacteriochlorophyllide A dehydrogenase